MPLTVLWEWYPTVMRVFQTVHKGEVLYFFRFPASFLVDNLGYRHKGGSLCRVAMMLCQKKEWTAPLLEFGLLQAKELIF